jgi:ribose 5-phosphate isomerase B
VADTPSPAEIRQVARDLLAEALRAEPQSGFQGARSGQRELINEAHVMAAKESGVLLVPKGAIVTPLARDAAERFQVELRFQDGSADGTAPVSTAREAEAPPEPSPRDQGGPVAIGSDHGGFKLKESLKQRLASAGLPVIDVGTTSDASCDYPDFAARVGRAVSMGEARFGVFVDGAGIGGAMALNKVPGVLAATCNDVKAAQNARGHNSANVLCMGSGWLDEVKAAAVLDAFLGAGFEGGRHARRVAKIRSLERAFVRTSP